MMRTTALAALLAATLAAPALAEPGSNLGAMSFNGPALDGAQIALPTEIQGGCPFEKCGGNGPLLDGERIALPKLEGEPVLLPDLGRAGQCFRDDRTC